MTTYQEQIKAWAADPRNKLEAEAASRASQGLAEAKVLVASELTKIADLIPPGDLRDSFVSLTTTVLDRLYQAGLKEIEDLTKKAVDAIASELKSLLGDTAKQMAAEVAVGVGEAIPLLGAMIEVFDYALKIHALVEDDKKRKLIATYQEEQGRRNRPSGEFGEGRAIDTIYACTYFTRRVWTPKNWKNDFTSDFLIEHMSARYSHTSIAAIGVDTGAQFDTAAKAMGFDDRNALMKFIPKMGNGVPPGLTDSISRLESAAADLRVLFGNPDAERALLLTWQAHYAALGCAWAKKGILTKACAVMGLLNAPRGIEPEVAPGLADRLEWMFARCVQGAVGSQGPLRATAGPPIKLLATAPPSDAPTTGPSRTRKVWYSHREADGKGGFTSSWKLTGEAADHATLMTMINQAQASGLQVRIT